KVRLAELLSRAGNIPREVLQFGLFGRAGLGVTIGANRNALHLYTTGRQFLSTDDDVFCQIAAAPQSSAVPVVGNLDRYTQFWFFPDRQATLAAVQETDLDLLTTHEEFLGANVASYLAAREGEYEFHLREID